METTIKNPQSVFNKMAKGIHDGDWQDYFDLFADDLIFWLPTPGPFNGKNTGKENYQKFLLGQLKQLALHVDPPYRTATAGNQMFLGYVEHVKSEEYDFQNRVFLALTWQNNVITHLEEYYGDVSMFLSE